MVPSLAQVGCRMRFSSMMLGAVLGCGACAGGAAKDSGSVDESRGSSDLAGGYYPSSLSPGATITLARCTDGVSNADIDKTVALVFDMEQSYHEMIGCGGMVVILASAVIDVIASLVEDPKGGLPDGFTQDGEGTYLASPGGGTVMEMRFVYGDSYEVGAVGEPVQYNLFRLSNYLVNPRVDFDYESGNVLIRYDEAGPLVELLGFGASPERPIRVNLDNLGRITREIEKLGVASTVVVTDTQANSDVSFHIASGEETVQRLVSGQPLSFELVTTAAVHHTLPQAAEVAVWDVEYADHAMNGGVEFAVNGGAFAFHGSFDYRDSTWPEIALSCGD